MKKTLCNILYFIVKLTAWVFSKVFFRLKVVGKDNLPEKGPFIIAANHTSFLDPIVASIAVSSKMRWIAKKDVCKKPFLKPLHYILGTICMNGAVEEALDNLEKGEILGIFPEGARSSDGTLKEANKGIAVLALRSAKYVVPIGIIGAYEAYGPGMKMFKPYPITVKIGKPILFKKTKEEHIDEVLINKTKASIMEKIGELLS